MEHLLLGDGPSQEMGFLKTGAISYFKLTYFIESTIKKLGLLIKSFSSNLLKAKVF